MRDILTITYLVGYATYLYYLYRILLEQLIQKKKGVDSSVDTPLVSCIAAAVVWWLAAGCS